MKRHLHAVLAATLTLFGLPAHAQLVINELMQSNIDCLMDDLNQFPDSWVELYNGGSTAVNLHDYRLGTDADASLAWLLPSRMVAPGQHVVVYCDKEDKGLHAPFRLESGNGGGVWLFRGTDVADAVASLAKQPAPNIAYGRRHDGTDEWGYQASATPGATNCGTLAATLLGEPLFSTAGCVVTNRQPITLTLSVPEGTPPNTQIRLTYDGSEPTATSTVYTGPVTISSTRVIRAKLFSNGCLSPRSTTHSYLFLNRPQTLPVVSLVTDNRYLNDSKIGIYVSGSYQKDKNNYDFNWRRPVNMEYFPASGEPAALNQLGETRIQGGASRGQQLKSMVVYAHKRFGKKRLKHEFFPDQRPGQDDFKSIILRNAGNDFDYLYMRDAVIQRTMASHTDLDWQAWQPAIVYINGTYRGILNLRERSTKDNIYTNYGTEDIDMVENWNELKTGDKENFNLFTAFYGEQGHTLAEYAQWMDWEEFINLMLMNLYYNNQDFPGNNIVMWRPRTAEGRWRFVAKDTDFGLGLYGSSASYKTLEWLYNPNYDSNRAWANQYQHTRLFRRLMDDADFRREFIDRASIYMGTFMNSTGTRQLWDPMYELIKTEYPYHRALINQWWPNYSSELNTARQWLTQRTASFYQQLADFYKLGAPTPLSVNTSLTPADRTAAAFTLNGVRLDQGTFDGKFFAGRTLTVEGATADDGRVVTGWRLTQVGTSGATTTTEVAGASHTFAMPTCRSLTLTALLGEPSGIGDVRRPSWSWRLDDGAVVVDGVAAGTDVSLFDARGMLLARQRAAADAVRLPLPPGPRPLVVLRVADQSVKLRP